MEGNEIVWPWGMTDRDPDPASRPWVFNPKGFMVAVVEDAGEAEVAKAALREAGFADTESRIFTATQLLEDRERFLAQQRPVRRLVERVTSDTDAVQLFLEYAHDGRSFVWVHVPDKKDAGRAVRGLSTLRVLHVRYYGDDVVEDIHLR
jgi:hypothetical protein